MAEPSLHLLHCLLLSRCLWLTPNSSVFLSLPKNWEAPRMAFLSLSTHGSSLLHTVPLLMLKLLTVLPQHIRLSCFALSVEARWWWSSQCFHSIFDLVHYWIQNRQVMYISGMSIWINKLMRDMSEFKLFILYHWWVSWPDSWMINTSFCFMGTDCDAHGHLCCGRIPTDSKQARRQRLLCI